MRQRADASSQAVRGVVTLAGAGQLLASRCSCSEVWLQESRSEQQAERPSLFIREEMKLQPQPHIGTLICGFARSGGSDGDDGLRANRLEANNFLTPRKPHVIVLEQKGLPGPETLNRVLRR
ncbi:hypothetical protein DPEC_G00182460 [Dallia pectoralis]|uniref:Uncharacterized protein n=1 Tax=Dallia pectoralis TaxID=75939 RepID=A0ACC2GAG7_DALPE|nr:hypothetical protein DPEC_G00182460 [Dallia pectoralis]